MNFQKKKTAAFFALYSVLLRKDGRFIEALKYIERAQEIGDDSFDFKKLKLAVFKDQQNYEKMESFAEAILEENDRVCSGRVSNVHHDRRRIGVHVCGCAWQ